MRFMIGLRLASLWVLSFEVAAETRCGTPAFFDDFIGVAPKVLPPPPPSPSKAIRDAQPGVCSDQEVSENFVLKWGPDAVPATDEIRQIIAALEASWQHELNIMNHSHPYGTNTYRFNVYVGDSGGCAPSAFGMGGYYTVDTDGWPFIVLSQGVFNNPDFGRTTVAHEFYHAVQHAEDAFTSGEDVQWWWEATAMWVEGQVYPGTEGYYVFLYGYAFEPQRQLNAYKYPQTFTLEEYHQYGAAIWPRYLTEFVTGWELIRDTWTLGGGHDDPIALVGAMLDVDIADVFADFAAHNATWDYLHGENIGAYLDYISETQSFGEQDRRMTGFVATSGTGAVWQEPPPSTLPQRFGYNTIRMNRPKEGTVVIRFQGDELGDDGSVASWRLRVVTERPSGPVYTEVALTDGRSEVEIEVEGTEHALYLVASVTSPAWNEGETFDYRYQMDAGVVSSGGPPVPLASAGAYQPYVKGSRGGCSGLPYSGDRAAWFWMAVLVGLCARSRGRQA